MLQQQRVDYNKNMINLSNLKKTNNKKESVLIIDGANIMIRAFSISQRYQKNLYAYFLNDVSRLVSKFMPSVCYIVFDGQNNSAAKRKLFPQYKMNRKGVSKIQTEDYQSVFQLLKQLPLIMIRKDGIEGDNVISHLKLMNKDKEIIICSSDQDFYQLIDQKTHIWNPIKKVIIDEKNVIDNFDCHPKNFVLYKCLVGDSGDNIPGVKGVGPKTIKKILPQILKKQSPLFGDLDNLLQHLRTIEKTNKVITRILEQESNLRIYQKIITLQDGIMLNPQLGSIITQQVKNKLNNIGMNIKQFTNLANKNGISKKELGSIFSGMRRLNAYKLSN